MTTEDAERSPVSSDETAGSPASDHRASGPPPSDPSVSDRPVSVGRYSWRSFLRDRGRDDAATELYADISEEPVVPATAVDAHFEDSVDRVIRAAGVDETYTADGDTAVSGHGTPEAGTVVIGTDHVVLSGAAVVPAGTSTAAVAPDPVESVDETVEGDEDDVETDRGEEDGEADDGEGDDEDGSDEDGSDETAEAADESAESDRADSDDPDARPGISIDGAGVSGVVVVPAEDVEPVPRRTPTDEEWSRVDIDPSEFLGFDPSETGYRVGAAAAVGDVLWDLCSARYNLYEVPVLKGYYTWDDYRDEYFLDEEGNPPTEENEEGEEEPLEFTHDDKVEALGFDPDRTEELLGAGGGAAADLAELVDERTVDVNPEIDEDAFFSTEEGHTTLANRYDLEKAVPMPKKTHFREIERYWVNKPYAFVIVFRSTKENEVKYYAIQPHRTEIETDLVEFLTGKLRTSIKYADESIAGGDEEFREGVIVDETLTLLDRYDLYERTDDDRGVVDDLVDDLVDRFGFDLTEGIAGRISESLGYEPPTEPESESAPAKILARPEPAVLAEDSETLSKHQVEKLLYFLKRDFIGYERIDPIKYDINVEDISCDGYNSPVFVYHSDYEQIITNVYHGTDELDDFVVKLAQRSGKGISKRRPQVDATLPDGSRAQLTLGREVSDHGTNYTIRQFNEIPFTPIDLINWKTFSLDEMAFLWLSIENHKSLIFAGGTASGKTTSLNAVSLFIPSNAKIVSIEDTREVELPQRNWIASVTRPSFSDDDKGDIDEFDLLEAALRQRPDYIVMGEIRGEEGRTAFQVMSTGHTTYTTFHADTVGEVLKRFTTEPINVSKTMFTALDLVSVQTSTRVQGKKVRRNKSLTEINHYDAENDEINVQDVFQWQAETDEFLQMGDSNTLEDIMFDRGWSRKTLDEELRKRRVVLAYLIDRGLNSYAQVAATFQAFINDPETVLALMANEELERSLEDLREMESVLINVDRDKEEMVPRPDPDEAGREEVERILAEAEDLFAEYRGRMPDSVADALLDVAPARNVEAQPVADREALAQAADEAAALDGESSATNETDETDETEEGRIVADATPPIEGFEAGVTAEGSFADGSDARDGDRTGDTSDGENADDTDDPDGGIDFDEPFDEGIDVLDSRPDSGPVPGPNPNPAPDPNPEQADSGVRADADGGVTEVEVGVEDAKIDDEDAGDAATRKESGDTESDDEGEGDTATEGEDEDDDGNNADNIDDWGFGSVESREER
ncbi:ATPase, T2SS/T4P/T4SS family [Halorubrum lacusprofundi]|jgi:flagellar protein FlaI|uniref:Type II secretion system protein E n=1 Tax=Halorubrum lacusprofundi (strain ATCC 49239 / DSM 5036 / JCM 8891 / ACAM 34) TaxID=416348 RepID=B9LMI8_HALLT|nr:ATPase, T2SS/T4P/T4SS family [Halorubrum lacusprofundi]ACM56576.1 type II secretion system protein E [Halorubrum lacusprofundi ATCC 49239]MCG1005157.1 Flp pilus assembly complex ATPase component TadA [Halorubrum lacusprofundi]